MIASLQPFFVSFIIGMLIGIERERRHANGKKKIGLRTFILFALLGTLSAKINNPNLTLSLSLFVFATLLSSYFYTSRQENEEEAFGITTEMAGATVFMLGFLMIKHMLLSIFISTAVLSILYGREALHQFAREKITAQEMEAAIIIIIISLVIISFLPDKTIDPWQLFNPQKYGMILLVLAGLQFGGHIGIRIFGKKLGMIFLGFFGGLISSTAVFASLSHSKRKKKEGTSSAVIAGIYATIATLIGFVLVILVVSADLTTLIIWPIGAAILFGGVTSWLVMHFQRQEQITIEYHNPLDIKAIFKLTLLITSILLLVGGAKQYIGSQALPVTAFITGLIDIHAIGFAIATLFAQQELSLLQATELLAIVILASFVSKFALIWGIAHNRFAVLMSAFLIGMLAIASMVYFFVFKAYELQLSL